MCLLTRDSCRCWVSSNVNLFLILGVSGNNRLLLEIRIFFWNLKIGSMARFLLWVVIGPELLGLRSLISVVLSEQPVFKVISRVVFGSIRICVCVLLGQDWMKSCLLLVVIMNFPIDVAMRGE